MAWWVMERSNGAKLLKEFETRDEAEKAKAELIALDPTYEDVLVIRRAGSAREPESEGR